MKKHIENTIENPITANSVRDNNDDNIIDAGVCYWVTGHSMGAGVANLVAASLISSEARIMGTDLIIFLTKLTQNLGQN